MSVNIDRLCEIIALEKNLREKDDSNVSYSPKCGSMPVSIFKKHIETAMSATEFVKYSWDESINGWHIEVGNMDKHSWWCTADLQLCSFQSPNDYDLMHFYTGGSNTTLYHVLKLQIFQYFYHYLPEYSRHRVKNGYEC
jgi:hypothetical protein